MQPASIINNLFNQNNELPFSPATEQLPSRNILLQGTFIIYWMGFILVWHYDTMYGSILMYLQRVFFRCLIVQYSMFIDYAQHTKSYSIQQILMEWACTQRDNQW